MAPEFSKAALGVYPMIPFYAVDCDKQSNKRLCAEQGVQGFPTVKACLLSAPVQPTLTASFASLSYFREAARRNLRTLMVPTGARARSTTLQFVASPTASRRSII